MSSSLIIWRNQVKSSQIWPQTCQTFTITTNNFSKSSCKQLLTPYFSRTTKTYGYFKRHFIQPLWCAKEAIRKGFRPATSWWWRLLTRMNANKIDCKDYTKKWNSSWDQTAFQPTVSQVAVWTTKAETNSSHYSTSLKRIYTTWTVIDFWNYNEILSS